MSQQYSIKNLLNIKDENIHILENEVTTEEIKGIKTKVIHAKLTYDTDECPHCQAQEIYQEILITIEDKKFICFCHQHHLTKSLQFVLSILFGFFQYLILFLTSWYF